MGEAKRRGTREQRIEQRIRMGKAWDAAVKAAEDARWEALTPEQRQEELKAKRQRKERTAKFHQMMAMAMAIGRGR